MIEVKNLTMKYDARVVIDNLSFSMADGEYIAVLGENGSGKSTLAKAIVGLAEPASGSVRHDFKRGDVGYLPQLRDRTSFPATVSEVVLSGTLGASAKPFYSRTDKNAAADAMARLGISELAKRPFSELSGGQMRRVLIARTLCAGRRLLILDEPTAGLDPVASAELYELLAGINKNGVGVLIISHDTGAALRYADRILHLGIHADGDDAHCYFFGTPDEYASSEAGRRYIDAGGCD